MKKIICLAVCFLMTLSLFAGCKKQGSDKETILHVGYARADVTPTYSVPLAGFGDNRGSTGVLDPLYITCVAMKDGEGNTFLLYHCDFLGADAVLLYYERQISKETGVPMDNIITCGTHNHSAPSLSVSSDEFPVIGDYVKLCRDAMMQSAKDALADLKPARVYVASKKCEKMTYVRHYVRKNGTINGNGGNGSELYTGYAAQVDDTMQLIKFTREGGKDVVLMNWQGHPRGHSGLDASYYGQSREERRGLILSDVDIIRKNIEPALDCHFAYFLGASGNVNNCSSMWQDQITKNYVEHGKKLTELAVEASADFKEVKTGILRRETVAVEVTKNDGVTKTTVSASVFAMGKSVAFVIVAYEMFSESALEIKGASKFDCTFISTVSEGSGGGYMPTEATFDPLRYRTEAYEVRVTHYKQGTAEIMSDACVKLLNKMYE